MTTRGNMRLSASDKSEEFVVMSQALDREITNLHLQDETIYRRVTEKEFFVQCKCLNHVWMSGKSAGLDKRFVSRLKLDKPSCPVFYSLIKTSKLNPDEMNSTSAATFKIRPEISCVGGPTDRISWFLNKIKILMCFVSHAKGETTGPLWHAIAIVRQMEKLLTNARPEEQQESRSAAGILLYFAFLTATILINFVYWDEGDATYMFFRRKVVLKGVPEVLFFNRVVGLSLSVLLENGLRNNSVLRKEDKTDIYEEGVLQYT
ncbi:hypothetical protein RB195_025200 [Necator americanus]|uniref:Uncharacterized protein n=1 Tax=Necator americanus TaxID=51031 RepID=A0ABR1ER94_NECAM